MTTVFVALWALCAAPEISLFSFISGTTFILAKSGLPCTVLLEFWTFRTVAAWRGQAVSLENNPLAQ